MSKSEETLKKHCPSMDNLFMDDERRQFRTRIFDAMTEYARECCIASLKKASEKGKIESFYLDETDNVWSEITNGNFQFNPETFAQKYCINKKSITNPENITLI